ncbi:MAG: phage baseplate assembly protein V [Caldilineaceae bacterium]
MNLFDQLLAPPAQETRFYGVVIALVTNNKDPEGLGRVKVQYPWLSTQDESHWARVATPMAGKQRGFYYMPEVDDEVLVAFEHGLVEYPYVLGALWNGKDKPPVDKEGQNAPDVRVIKTTSGHIVRLDDTQNAEKIEIIDKSGKDMIIIDAQANTITIQSDKDLTIESKAGALTLSGKTVEIKSTGGAVKVNSQADLELKANGSLKQNGATAELKANANLTIKGAVVNIN